MKFILIDFQNIFCGGFGSLGLVTLLRKCGHEAYVIGTHNVLNLINNAKKFKRIILDELPDVVGFSVMTPYADYIDDVGKLVHEAVGDIPIILGGYHATIFKENIFRENKYVDYVIIGDGEKSLPLLLNAIKRGEDKTIDGVLSRFNMDYRHESKNFIGSITNCLDEIPYPDEETIHPKYYSRYLMGGHGCLPRPSRYVLYSRGCPYRCSFCIIENDGGFRSKVRYYSAKGIIEHLGTLVERYGLRGIAFLDDNFTVNKKWAYEICEGISKNHIRIKWWAQVRANALDIDLMRAMHSCGCIAVTISIESGNDRIRNEVLGKKVAREQIRKAYETAKNLGMLTQGTLMMGSPTETNEECANSVSFLQEVDPDYAGVVLTTLLPGTPLYKKYEDQIKITCYRDYDIELQEKHYFRDDVRLAFHEMSSNFLLRVFHRIRNQYSYTKRARLSLRNLTSKERFWWMIRNYMPSIKAKFSQIWLTIRDFYRYRTMELF